MVSTIGVLDNSYLKKFEHTIKWIKKDIDAISLPKVALLNTYHFYDDHPAILVYLRKTDNINLPYAVCEFHFTCFTLIAIIPTLTKDECNFSEGKAFDEFWNFFTLARLRGGNFGIFYLHFNVNLYLIYNCLKILRPIRTICKEQNLTHTCCIFDTLAKKGISAFLFTQFKQI